MLRQRLNPRLRQKQKEFRKMLLTSQCDDHMQKFSIPRVQGHLNAEPDIFVYKMYGEAIYFPTFALDNK